MTRRFRWVFVLVPTMVGACAPRGVGAIDPLLDGGNSDGTPGTDTASPPPDTSAPPADTGTPPGDTGNPPVDTGSPPADTGTPPVDTGSPPVDTGASMDGPAPVDAPPAEDISFPTDGPRTAPDGGPLPNLTINAERMSSSVLFEYRDFGRTACDLVEGCITTPGRRRLLRFDLETPNVGLGDAFLGVPARGDPRFEDSTCHGHRHFLGYALYRLLNAAGAEIARGHKQSFCLLDSRRTGLVSGARASAQYTCSNQGISSGWSDIYGRGLDCQYVDITDVPAGTYRLNVVINRFAGIPESDYTDNTAEVMVTIPPAGDAGTPPDASVPPESITGRCAMPTGVDRNCGWTPESAPRSCTPGQMVFVGCNAGCTPPLGSCTGDPMIRVCETTPCSNADALGQNDDACPPSGGGGNLCAQAQFRCPASGRYLVMTAGYNDRAFTCPIAVRAAP